MKRILLTSAVALIASAANAADMYSTKDTPVYNAPAASPVWTGFYFGANVGGGWSQLDSSLTLSDGERDSITIAHTNAASGIVGGGQAGYNWQTGAFVLGVEADFGILGFSQTRDIISASFGGSTLGLGTRFEGGFLADVTGRIGYASGPALFYAKGGWAYLDATAGIDAPTPFNVSKTGFDGWTIGGGIEYRMGPSWSVKAEYQHFDFGSFTLLPVPEITELAIKNDLTVETVKVGLNYHVNSGYTPLK